MGIFSPLHYDLLSIISLQSVSSIVSDSLSLLPAVSMIFISVLSVVGAVSKTISQRAPLLWLCSDVLISDPFTLVAPAYPSYITDTALILLDMETQQ